MTAPRDPETASIPADIAAMNFEQALAELEAIINRLESGAVDLENSIEIYSRGALLKAHCEAKLRAAQARVERIVVGADGVPTARPEDLD